MNEPVLSAMPILTLPFMGVDQGADLHVVIGKGLPEGSIVCNQLMQVANSNVKQLPQTLNAVNTLRFVVCGFEKYRPTNSHSDWRSKIRQGTWRTA